MFTMRLEMYQALCKAREERFVEGLAEYARETFPEEAKTLSDMAMDAIVRQAMEKTEQYNITEQSDICQYVNFMFIYGVDFDVELPWAQEILNNPYTRLGTAKMLELHEMAVSPILADGNPLRIGQPDGRIRVYRF